MNFIVGLVYPDPPFVIVRPLTLPLLLSTVAVIAAPTPFESIIVTVGAT